jgi:hypothetical protein
LYDVRRLPDVYTDFTGQTAHASAGQAALAAANGAKLVIPEGLPARAFVKRAAAAIPPAVRGRRPPIRALSRPSRPNWRHDQANFGVSCPDRRVAPQYGILISFVLTESLNNSQEKKWQSK